MNENTKKKMSVSNKGKHPKKDLCAGIEKRLIALETGLSVPGTSLSRCMRENGGVVWVLAIGSIQLPKAFFYGDTIEEVIGKAEKNVRSWGSVKEWLRYHQQQHY
jgi:hypothetical protein